MTKKPLITPQFRVSYPSVFKPRLNDLNGKMEYSVEALFAKGEKLDALQKAVEEAIVEKWGQTAKAEKDTQGNWGLSISGKLVTVVKDGKTLTAPFRIPFKNQGDKEKDGVLPPAYEKNAVFISLKSQQKPGVVDQNVQPIIDGSDFYAGCYAQASVNASAYEQKGNRGVSIYLNNIQKVKDGDPLGSRGSPQSDFAAVEGAEKESADNLF